MGAASAPAVRAAREARSPQGFVNAKVRRSAPPPVAGAPAEGAACTLLRRKQAQRPPRARSWNFHQFTMADHAALLRRKKEIERRLAQLRGVDLPNAQRKHSDLVNEVNAACGSELPAKLLIEQCKKDRDNRHEAIREVITAVGSAVDIDDIQEAPGITDRFLDALAALPQCKPSYPQKSPAAAPASSSSDTTKQHDACSTTSAGEPTVPPERPTALPDLPTAPRDPLSAAAQAAVPQPTGARFRKRAPARLSIPDGPGAFARSVMASAPPMHCGLEGVQLLPDPPRELPNSARSCHSIESYSSC